VVEPLLIRAYPRSSAATVFKTDKMDFGSAIRNTKISDRVRRESVIGDSYLPTLEREK